MEWILPTVDAFSVEIQYYQGASAVSAGAKRNFHMSFMYHPYMPWTYANEELGHVVSSIGNDMESV